MENRPDYFGGRMRVRMGIGHEEDVLLEREFWFDRDIDGRWLVGVFDPRRADDDIVGAIVVKDPKVGAFIEVLGALLAEPERFTDEKLTINPAWDGHLAD